MIQEVLSLPDLVAVIDASLPPAVDDPEHLDDDDVAAFVAGTAGAEERRRALQHLPRCTECRNEVATLRRWTARRKLRMALASPAFLAIAASVAIVSAATFVFNRPSETEVRRTATSPPRVSVAPSTAPDALPKPANVADAMPPEWRALVDRALRTRELPLPPDLREMAAQDTFRGATSEAVVDRVWPSATAVTDPKPRLVWPAVAGGEYIVTLGSDRDSTRSEILREPRWRPPNPLSRGDTYSWQVDVKRGEELFSIPAPPAPPAVFRVITSAEADEIDAARRQFPDDHLLIGLLYAKAGVVDEARRHLQAWHRASRDPAADALLAQLPTP